MDASNFTCLTILPSSPLSFHYPCKSTRELRSVSPNGHVLGDIIWTTMMGPGFITSLSCSSSSSSSHVIDIWSLFFMAEVDIHMVVVLRCGSKNEHRIGTCIKLCWTTVMYLESLVTLPTYESLDNLFDENDLCHVIPSKEVNFICKVPYFIQWRKPLGKEEWLHTIRNPCFLWFHQKS